MKDSSSVWNYSNTVPKVDLTNPDEMIRANGAAEAAQTDRLKAEVEDYTQVLAELRELYEKNNELVQKLQFMNRNTTEGIRTLIEDNDHKAFRAEMQASINDAREQIIGSIRESSGETRDLFQEANDFNHRDNVRVYRNVQASMIAELTDQTKELNEKLEIIQKQSEPDRAQTTMQKVSVGLLIAVMVIQVLEGAGLIALLTGILH